MARLTRLCPSGIPQHIIQRGNNRQPCFTCDEDVAAYASWLAEAAERYKIIRVRVKLCWPIYKAQKHPHSRLLLTEQLHRP